MAIRDLQAQYASVGSIRIGADMTGRRFPDKLDTLRFTSPIEDLITAVASKYGGNVTPFTRGRGPQWQVVTDAAAVPVGVPRQVIDPWYEVWDKSSGKAPVACVRRCDGVTEQLRQTPCLCAPAMVQGGERARVCKPTTRWVVDLADIPGTGVWTCRSTGGNVARELSTLADWIGNIPPGVRVPARLWLDKRSSPYLDTDTDQTKPQEYGVLVLSFDALTALDFQDPDRLAAIGAAPRQDPDRQALPAGDGGRSDTLLSLYQQAAAATDHAGLTAVRERAQQSGVSDPGLIALVGQKWQAFSAPAATRQRPPAPAPDVVDAELVDTPSAPAGPEPDRNAVMQQLVTAAGPLGWKTAQVMAHIANTTGKHAHQCTGHELTRALNKLPKASAATR